MGTKILPRLDGMDWLPAVNLSVQMSKMKLLLAVCLMS